MSKKWFPHIIATGSFVVFIVLGLASASSPDSSDSSYSQNTGREPQQVQQYNGNEVGFEWKRSGEGIVITGYTGRSREVQIPSEIQGMPVIEIGDEAFREKNIASVTIGNGVSPYKKD